MLDAIDLFAGPGGWDVAAARLGLYAHGIEFDSTACQTRRAAGLSTTEGDVRDYGPGDFPARGLIASPPCQPFSMSGKGAGRAALDTVESLARAMARREPVDLSGFNDSRTALVLEPLRWALEAIDLGRPYEWLAFEQVPTVRPVWETFAELLRAEGYSVEVGNLQAEQYGVPQTRRRAILVARLGTPVALPEPTHSRYYSRAPERLDAGVRPWVSMAAALGWGLAWRPSPTITGGGTETGGAEPIAKLARYSSDPGWTRRGVRAVFGHAAASFQLEDEGTTARLTIQEASRLQSFPTRFPWHGNQGRQFLQVGNAVPPLLAEAVLAAVTRKETS